MRVLLMVFLPTFMIGAFAGCPPDAFGQLNRIAEFRLEVHPSFLFGTPDAFHSAKFIDTIATVRSHSVEESFCNRTGLVHTVEVRGACTDRDDQYGGIDNREGSLAEEWTVAECGCELQLLSEPSKSELALNLIPLLLTGIPVSNLSFALADLRFNASTPDGFWFRSLAPVTPLPSNAERGLMIFTRISWDLVGPCGRVTSFVAATHFDRGDISLDLRVQDISPVDDYREATVSPAWDVERIGGTTVVRGEVVEVRTFDVVMDLARLTPSLDALRIEEHAPAHTKHPGSAFLQQLLGMGDGTAAFFRENFQRRAAVTTSCCDVREELLDKADLRLLLEAFVKENTGVKILRNGKREAMRNTTIDQALSVMESNGSLVLWFEELRSTHLLTELQKRLEASFASPLTIHAYVSKRGIKALNIHSDPYPVFAIQLAGVKTWSVCLPPREEGAAFSSLPCEENVSVRDVIASATKWNNVVQNSTLECVNVTTHPGDVLHLPDGVQHSASGDSDELSIHLTVGLRQDRGLKWSDFLLDMLQAVKRSEISNPTIDLFSSTVRGLSRHSPGGKAIRGNGGGDVPSTALVSEMRLAFPVWTCLETDGGTALQLSQDSSDCALTFHRSRKLASLLADLVVSRWSPWEELTRCRRALFARSVFEHALYAFFDRLQLQRAGMRQWESDEAELRSGSAEAERYLLWKIQQNTTSAWTIQQLLQSQTAEKLPLQPSPDLSWTRTSMEAQQHAGGPARPQAVLRDSQAGDASAKGRALLHARPSLPASLWRRSISNTDPLAINIGSCTGGCDWSCECDGSCGSDCRVGCDCDRWGGCCGCDCDIKACLGCDSSCECDGCDEACSSFNCIPGSYRAAGRCWECGPGTFSNGYDHSSCQLCPAGYHEPMSRSTMCDPCPAGWAQADRGKSSCSRCLEGTYQPDVAQPQCIPCQAGTFQPSVAATTCIQCSAGSFQASTGASACDVCGPGKYQPFPGMGSCIECDQGTSQDSVGATSCIECPAGEHQPDFAQTSCVACPDGTFQAFPGMTSCGQCELMVPQPLECEICRTDGSLDIQHGHCVAENPTRCFTTLQDDWLQTASKNEIELGTSESGCRFCSESSPSALNFTDPIPCPLQLCMTVEDEAWTTECSSGSCQTHQRCKECETCSDPLIGCNPMPHHCIIDEACGCLIEGVCYHLDATEPGNLCRRASQRFPASPASRCTGSWVADTDGSEQVPSCAGTTACARNQQCRQGECVWDPYDPPEPCAAAFECSGNEDMYSYELLQDVDLPLVCRPENTTEPCDLPEFCTSSFVSCPHRNNVAIPNITLSHTSVGFVFDSERTSARFNSSQFASARSMLTFSSVIELQCSDIHGAALESCPLWVGAPFSSLGGQAPVCGLPAVRFFLEVLPESASQWPTCSDDILPALSVSLHEGGVLAYGTGEVQLVSVALESALQPMPSRAELRAMVLVEGTVTPSDSPTHPPVRHVACSSPVVFDSTPPPAGILRLQGIESATGFMIGQSSQIVLDWRPSEWHDPDTGFAEIHAEITTASTPSTTLVDSVIQATSPTALSFPELSDGTNLLVRLKVTNGAQLTTFGSWVEALVDSSAPVFTGDMIYDCEAGVQSRDLSFRSSRDSLSVCWHADDFFDVHSGISRFEVQLYRRYRDGLWQQASSVCSVVQNATGATFHHSDAVCADPQDSHECFGVCIMNGMQFRVAVRAINGAGLPEDWQSDQGYQFTDGVRVDDTPPEIGQLHAINPLFHEQDSCLAGQTHDVQGSGSEVMVEFADWRDPEGDALFFLWEIGELSGLDGAFIPTVQPLQALGATSWDTSLLSPATVPAPSSRSAAAFLEACTDCNSSEWATLTSLRAESLNLSLRHNSTIVVRLFALNDAGLVSSKSTSIRIDLTPPHVDATLVNDVVSDWYADFDHVASPSALFVFARSADCESKPVGHSGCELGIASYQYAFGTERGLSDVVALSEQFCYPELFSAFPELRGGARYFATVRVCNRAGLCSTVASDGIMVDFSSPNGGNVIDGASSDVDFLPLGSQLCLSWSNFTDPQSGIKSYKAGYGPCSSPGLPELADVGLAQTHCFKDAILERQVAYCGVIQAENAAGQLVFSRSDGVTFAALPIAGSVSDGLAAQEDIDYQSNVSKIGCRWKGFSSDAPHLTYEVSFLSDSLHEVYGLRNVSSAAPQSIFGAVRVGGHMFSTTEITLSHGLQYFCKVCVVDILNQTTCAVSDGFVVDAIPPVVSHVFNGALLDEHIAVQSDTSAVSAIWRGFQSLSPIRSCSWALGFTRYSENIMRFTAIGTTTRASAPNLLLSHDDTVHVTVRCTTWGGLSAASTSDTILIDTRAPTIGDVELRGPQGAPLQTHHVDNVFVLTTTDIVVTYNASAGSHVEWAIGRFPGAQDVRSWSPVQPNHAAVALPALRDGSYFVSFLAQDSLNRGAAASSLRLVVDSTPPFAQTSSSPPPRCMTSDFVNTTVVDFVDPETGVALVEMGLGSTAGDASLHPFVDVSGAHHATLHGPFTPGPAYVTVRAVNPVGLSAETSRLVLIDATPPSVDNVTVAVVDRQGRDTESCVGSTGSVQAHWSAFSDSECEMARYACAVVRAGVNNTGVRGASVEFVDAGLGRWCEWEGELEAGALYRMLVRGWNAAGLHSDVFSSDFRVAPHPVEIVSTSICVPSGIARASGTVRGLIELEVSAGDLDPVLEVGLGSCRGCTDIVHWTDIRKVNYSYEEADALTQSSAADLLPSNVSLAATMRYYSPCPNADECMSARVYLLFRDAPPSTALFLSVSALTCSRLRTESTSAACVQDSSPPFGGKLFLGNTDQEPTAFHDHIHVRWDPFQDPETGVALVEMGLGSTAGDASLHPFVDVSGAHHATLHGPFTPGPAYVTVRAVNPVGLSAETSRLVLIDATPPSVDHVTVAVVDRQGRDTESCVGSTGSVQAHWSAFSDSECEMARYACAVVRAGVNNTGVRGASVEFVDAGLGRWCEWEGELEAGALYRMLVRGWNAAGLHSDVFSDVFVADDGDLHLDLSLIATTNNLTTQTYNFQVRVAAVGRLQALLCFAGGIPLSTELMRAQTLLSDLVGDEDFRERQHHVAVCHGSVARAATLHGHPIFVTVSATSCSGSTAVSSVFAGNVDLTAPSAATIAVIDAFGKETRHQSNTDAVTVEVDGFHEAESSTSVQLGIGRCGDVEDTIPLTAHHSTSTVELQASLADGKHFVSATASNSAGLTSCAMADFVVDTTPPFPSPIRFLSAQGLRVPSNSAAAVREALAVWAPFEDAESPLVGYRVRVDCSGFDSPAFHDLRRTTQFTIPASTLAACGNVSVSVQGWNAAGLFSESWADPFVCTAANASACSQTSSCAGLAECFPSSRLASIRRFGSHVASGSSVLSLEAPV